MCSESCIEVVKHSSSILTAGCQFDNTLIDVHRFAIFIAFEAIGVSLLDNENKSSFQICCMRILIGTLTTRMVCRGLVELMGKSKEHKKANVKPFMVKNYLSIFVNCMIENPAFDSQVSSQTLQSVTLAHWSLLELSRPYTPACFTTFCFV